MRKRPLRLAECDAFPLADLSQRLRVFGHEIDLGLAALERESEEGEQVHAVVLERREDSLPSRIARLRAKNFAAAKSRYRKPSSERYETSSS
jgi:hypothetical protein